MVFVIAVIIGLVAFAYVLSPMAGAQPRRQASAPGGRDIDEEFGRIVYEEASLEVAAGKMTREEFAQLAVPAEGETEAALDDEIEREIRARRKRAAGRK